MLLGKSLYPGAALRLRFQPFPMNKRTLAFLYSPEIERLSYPPDCPFKSQRAGLTRERLKSFGLLESEKCFEVAPHPASLHQLQWFHSARYLEEMQRSAAGDLTPDGFNMGLGGPDTPVFEDMFEWGAWACGAGLMAADLLLQRKADIVFNLLGGFHHAMAEHAAGFCYLNDMVLACLRLAGAGRRVLCLDVDTAMTETSPSCSTWMRITAMERNRRFIGATTC